MAELIIDSTASCRTQMDPPTPLIINLKSSCHAICVVRKGACEEERDRVTGDAKSDAKVSGLGTASGVPVITGEPTGEQGESSEKEKESRSWESKVMVNASLYLRYLSLSDMVLCHTHLTDETMEASGPPTRK